ncbi:MAG: PAS domain-containing protein [bacterium]|nr:PAS domain-containing protein [bacterium]
MPDELSLLRHTVNTISLPVIVVDRDFRMVFCNQALGRWNTEFDWKVDDLIGRPMFEVFSFLPQRVKDNYQVVLDTAQPLRSESLYHFGKKQLTVEVELLPIVIEEKVQYVVTLLRNVTQQRETQIALQQSEERFRLQFLALPLPTFTWEQTGTDFKLVSYNEAAASMTLGGAAKLIGLRASALYGEQSEIMSDLRTCLESREVVQREMLYQMKSISGQKYVRAYYVFIPPNQVQIHNIDLTANKEAEEQLRLAQQDLAKKIAERTQELKAANDQLTIERETLQRKNLFQQDLLDQIGESRRAAAMQIQANIDRVVMPLFEHMKGKVDGRCAEYMNLISSSLQEITSPLVSRLEQKFRHLTPQEIQICSLIRRGYSSKEIAGVRNSSVQTVLKQRKVIRRKLGLQNSEANLATYLSSIAVLTETDSDGTV